MGVSYTNPNLLWISSILIESLVLIIPKATKSTHRIYVAFVAFAPPGLRKLQFATESAFNDYVQEYEQTHCTQYVRHPLKNGSLTALTELAPSEPPPHTHTLHVSLL